MSRPFLSLPAIVISTLALATLPAQAACFAGHYTMKPKSDSVSDPKSGLTWQRCLPQQKGNFCTGDDLRMTQVEAAMYAKSQPGWRLPTHAELLTLTQPSCPGVAINSLFFPNQPRSEVWTSTQVDPLPQATFWIVEFAKGYDVPAKATNRYAVRLVRTTKQ